MSAAPPNVSVVTSGTVVVPADGVVPLEVACVYVPCQAALTLALSDGLSDGVVVGRSYFDVDASVTRRIAFELTPTARQLLRSRGRIEVLVNEPERNGSGSEIMIADLWLRR